jgi:hypothetical protein
MIDYPYHRKECKQQQDENHPRINCFAPEFHDTPCSAARFGDNHRNSMMNGTPGCECADRMFDGSLNCLQVLATRIVHDRVGINNPKLRPLIAWLLPKGPER